ncbi:Cysteine--tRNA ligase [Frankliniella fusca]|uniref:Cysteine--tRNA ligase n=1 Tax=Frankliniella fusca TaxID=407009 RepID=A0AAE1LGF6_9NEOP|nr:Cysteine--tRNA ligase [Frankliniella fusca]
MFPRYVSEYFWLPTGELMWRSGQWVPSRDEYERAQLLRRERFLPGFGVSVAAAVIGQPKIPEADKRRYHPGETTRPLKSINCSRKVCYPAYCELKPEMTQISEFSIEIGREVFTDALQTAAFRVFLFNREGSATIFWGLGLPSAPKVDAHDPPGSGHLPITDGHQMARWTVDCAACCDGVNGEPPTNMKPGESGE